MNDSVRTRPELCMCLLSALNLLYKNEQNPSVERIVEYMVENYYENRRYEKEAGVYRNLYATKIMNELVVPKELISSYIFEDLCDYETNKLVKGFLCKEVIFVHIQDIDGRGHNLTFIFTTAGIDNKELMLLGLVDDYSLILHNNTYGKYFLLDSIYLPFFHIENQIKLRTFKLPILSLECYHNFVVVVSYYEIYIFKYEIDVHHKKNGLVCKEEEDVVEILLDSDNINMFKLRFYEYTDKRIAKFCERVQSVRKLIVRIFIGKIHSNSLVVLFENNLLLIYSLTTYSEVINEVNIGKYIDSENGEHIIEIEQIRQDKYMIVSNKRILDMTLDFDQGVVVNEVLNIKSVEKPLDSFARYRNSSKSIFYMTMSEKIIFDFQMHPLFSNVCIILDKFSLKFTYIDSISVKSNEYLLLNWTHNQEFNPCHKIHIIKEPIIGDNIYGVIIWNMDTKKILMFLYHVLKNTMPYTKILDQDNNELLRGTKIFEELGGTHKHMYNIVSEYDMRGFVGDDSFSELNSHLEQNNDNNVRCKKFNRLIDVKTIVKPAGYERSILNVFQFYKNHDIQLLSLIVFKKGTYIQDICHERNLKLIESSFLDHRICCSTVGTPFSLEDKIVKKFTSPFVQLRNWSLLYGDFPEYAVLTDGMYKRYMRMLDLETNVDFKDRYRTSVSKEDKDKSQDEPGCEGWREEMQNDMKSLHMRVVEVFNKYGSHMTELDVLNMIFIEIKKDLHLKPLSHFHVLVQIEELLMKAGVKKLQCVLSETQNVSIRQYCIHNMKESIRRNIRIIKPKEDTDKYGSTNSGWNKVSYSPEYDIHIIPDSKNHRILEETKILRQKILGILGIDIEKSVRFDFGYMENTNDLKSTRDSLFYIFLVLKNSTHYIARGRTPQIESKNHKYSKTANFLRGRWREKSRFDRPS